MMIELDCSFERLGVSSDGGFTGEGLPPFDGVDALKTGLRITGWTMRSMGC